ncbi:hypothetical protein F3Y22_tig00112503pilonHSYRG00221 [Hibiscus syriacus]|uniref:Uncharacterized protein n=1 Tax=Hibiscus syriacus TaxID=106335 RepID=A0A6A2WWT3_HIBSY|nr:hypothetical protein F3Y22_tig00112503pilonHSYRG00221 [Hibiscus syriacus]
MATKFDIEKFNGRNFSLWKLKLKVILRKDGCLEAVKYPPQNGAVWDTRNRLALRASLSFIPFSSLSSRESYKTLSRLSLASLTRGKPVISRQPSAAVIPHRRPPHLLPIGTNLGKYLWFSKVFGDAWRPVVTPIEVLSSPPPPRLSSDRSLRRLSVARLRQLLVGSPGIEGVDWLTNGGHVALGYHNPRVSAGTI